ncbi:MAG: class SAM-dependent methyltransferase [Solirubrobacterales bacterium]|nr:class SAM-dependent methyltransferase [Solirubrobacterales bacterium]
MTDPAADQRRTPDMTMFTQEFWDERYRGDRTLWSGRPNPQLVARAATLTPASALDVGCGEGADVMWLAERGWTVTGADVSPVALTRAAARAAEAGPVTAARIQWRHVDLFSEDFEPFDVYHLVNSQYLHFPPQERDRALQRLAAAVSPGGSLLLVSHHPSDLEIPGLRPNVPGLFSTASELAAPLDRTEWEILTEAAPQRTVDGPGARPVTIRDSVLHARRRQ